MATGEFLQIVSDILQANYPVTTGLSPWVYNTPWPLSTFCMFVDYDGQPVASYYFLKRTYEPTHRDYQDSTARLGKGREDSSLPQRGSCSPNRHVRD